MNLIRLETSDQGTFGIMPIDLASSGIIYTGELPWRDNKPFVSCIPTGTYLCKLIKSPSRSYLVYTLLDVPDRDHILFHVANYFGNKDMTYRTDVEGCIGFGTSRGYLGGQHALLSSRDALNIFHDAVGIREFELTISEQYL